MAAGDSRIRSFRDSTWERGGGDFLGLTLFGAFQIHVAPEFECWWNKCFERPAYGRGPCKGVWPPTSEKHGLLKKNVRSYKCHSKWKKRRLSWFDEGPDTERITDGRLSGGGTLRGEGKALGEFFRREIWPRLPRPLVTHNGASLFESRLGQIEI